MVMTTYPSALAVGLFYRACLVVGVAAVLTAWLGRRHLARWAAPRPLPAGLAETVAARFQAWLAYGLGFLWLLDGVLQAQPLMVTHFVGGVVLPVLAGQPAILRAVIELGIRVWTVSPMWWNVGAAYLQACIGIALLFGRGDSPLRRAALWTSLGWGLVVWAVGEGFGGVFAGGGPLTGAPGSALLYALGAALALAPLTDRPARIGTWLRSTFAAYFVLMAALAAWPAAGWWQGAVLGGYIRAMAEMPQPAAIADVLEAAARLASHAPVAVNGAVVASSVVLAGLWVALPRARGTWLGTLVWTLAVWLFGQDFGVLGGMGTDPNTGGIVLVFVVLWARYGGQLAGAAQASSPETAHPGGSASSSPAAAGGEAGS